MVDVGALAWIQQEQELHANVVADVEAQLDQLVLQLVEVVGQLRNAEQSEAEQIEFLAIVQGGLVGQVVVYPLVQMIENEHVRPGVLQQFHLVIHLDGHGRKSGQLFYQHTRDYMIFQG